MIRIKCYRITTRALALLIITVFSGFLCVRVSLGSDSGGLAFLHLEEVMDEFHNTFNVYTDLSAAGNHFVALGKFSSTGDEDNVEIHPGFKQNCYSRDSCIENKFYSDGDNWGGWYFLNGILEGEDSQPKPNWGDTPDAGIDLTGATELTFWAKGKQGGERVEFFAFGVGRDPATGTPIESYPDSSPKISLGYVELANSWDMYTIDLSGSDLTYVLGGFGWATSAIHNNNTDITFYLDEIKYNRRRLNEPRFLVSYTTISSGSEFDQIMKNVAFTYDNALALIAFIARGTEADLQRAGLLADALVYAANHDRYFEDGRLRNAYQGGDLALPAGWKPNGRNATVRMPGWLGADGQTWHEDEFHVSSHTGNLAWAMIALLAYYEKAGGAKYLDTAVGLGEWIEEETREEACYGGFSGGYEGWEQSAQNPDGQTKVLWKSTEHNLDLYAAFLQLYKITGNSEWRGNALHAGSFVAAMWSAAEGRFRTGTTGEACGINADQKPADVNTWALMALEDTEHYNQGIRWVEDNCSVEESGFKGFDFNDDRDGIWLEGTAHMVMAYQMMGMTGKAKTYLSVIEAVQAGALNSNGKGIVAALHNELTTGFSWLYFNRLHIGATAWFIFAEKKYNPYRGTPTIALVHLPGIRFLLLDKQ